MLIYQIFNNFVFFFFFYEYSDPTSIYNDSITMKLKKVSQENPNCNNYKLDFEFQAMTKLKMKK